MHINRIVLPQLERTSKSSFTNIKKGLAISQIVQSSRPLLFQQVLLKLQSVKLKYPQIQELLRMLKPLLEKIKNYQNRERQVIQLTEQNMRAQQKVNELKLKLKKTESKYNKDISDLIKLKILAESSLINKNRFLLQCNHTQITNKIQNLIHKPNTPDLTLQYYQNKIKEEQTIKNHQQNIRQPLSPTIKIIELLPSQQNEDIVISNTQFKQNNLLTRHMNEVCLSQMLHTQQVSKLLKQKLQFIIQSHKQLKQIFECYKQQCIDRENQQIIMAKILLQKDLQ